MLTFDLSLACISLSLIYMSKNEIIVKIVEKKNPLFESAATTLEIHLFFST